MPVDIALATVRFVHTSGISADDVVNTFHFQPVDGTADEADIPALLNDFYNTVDVGGSGRALGEFFSNVLSRVVLPVVKVYDADPAGDGDPIVEAGIGLLDDPINDNALPSEVALCLSFASAHTSGTDPRKERGRVYTGPFNSATLASTGGSSRPDGNFLTTLVASATRLLAATGGAGGWTWSLFESGRAHSYTRRVAGVLTVVDVAASAWVGREVETAWVDNAWDTQRRRGEAPSAKTFA